MKKVSINKIAELAGVSKTTVSFVLNGRGDEKKISQPTQERIWEIVRKENYEANFMARSLSTGKSHTIGFIVPDISNPFFGSVARYIQLFAETRGYSVLVASTGEDIDIEHKLIAKFRSRQVDGLIVASAAKEPGEIEHVIQEDKPLVFFDRIFPEANESGVEINNYETAKALTAELISKGHQRLVLVSLTDFLPNIRERVRGFKDAISDAGYSSNQLEILEVDYHHIKHSSEEIMKACLSQDNPPTAFMFVNNVLASQALLVVNKFFNDRVNKLLFASFDHIDLFEYVKPKVISATQPVEAIARECVNLLINQINGKKEKTSIRFQTEIR